jgi:hypothetical protein
MIPPWLFGPKSKPISRCSDRELRLSLIIGTVFVIALFVSSFFFDQQSDWLTWSVRGFLLLWLVMWWTMIIREMRKR